MGSGGAATSERKVQLVGYDNFVRSNPKSDKFPIHRFHHVEFWCADATTTSKRFQIGLGMTLVAKSDLSTKNPFFASYVLQSNELVFAFTAPYSRTAPRNNSDVPLPHYDQQQAYDFISTHGLAVRAVGLLVDNATDAHAISVANGGISVLPPLEIADSATDTTQTISEVKLYGDVVIRYVSGSFKGPFLAGYQAVQAPLLSYGLQRLDHAVGNTHNLVEAVEYIMNFTGFHEFAEFIAKDVGTVDSGLNSMVLSNNNELVLLPVNEPTFGTKRKSQIQTYLEQNEGPGLQHLALKTDDIFTTVRAMRAQSAFGGFEFMPRASDDYYRNLPARIGDVLTREQYEMVEELGLLADKDDQGVLLQIFTQPLGDRPTIFVEIIQRVGCMTPVKDEVTQVVDMVQAGGCGGFGKGNFSELFKSIEDYERTLDV